MSLARELARRMLGQTKERPRGVSKESSKPPPTSSPEAQASASTSVPRACEPLTLPPVALEAPPPPAPVLKPGWRGNCRAISAATGRRCALLDGHDGSHRHGSTAFVAIALTDDDVARARARLDAAATARRFDSSPHENP